MRPAKQLFTLLLATVLILIQASCKQTEPPAASVDEDFEQVETAPWQAELGDEAYLGPMVVLSYETDYEEGITGIFHRQVKGLSNFIGQTKVPILVVFYDPLAEHAPYIISEMEKLAEQAKGDAAILLVTPEAKDDMLSMFERTLLPTVYMVKNGAVQGDLRGPDETGIKQLRKFIGLKN